MFGLGVGEILIILAFALIFIGPKKLPELARGLGKSIREFQRAKDDLLHHVSSIEPSDEAPTGVGDGAVSDGLDDIAEKTSSSSDDLQDSKSSVKSDAG